MLVCGRHHTQLNALGGLDGSVTEPEVFALFSCFGEIISVTLPRHQASKHKERKRILDLVLAGKTQGFAYVEFENENDALNAIDNMNMNEYRGMILRCNLAHSRSKF